jgi:hypothetical protein
MASGRPLLYVTTTYTKGKAKINNLSSVKSQENTLFYLFIYKNLTAEFGGVAQSQTVSLTVFEVWFKYQQI